MSSEQQFSYNGLMSTYAEAHSLLIGLAAGLLAGWSRSLRSDLRDEPHAAIGGLLVGVAVGTRLRGE